MNDGEDAGGSEPGGWDGSAPDPSAVVASETYDELAGVVDLFGAMTREELETALDELAFKQGRDADADALTAAVDGAVAAYYLVRYEQDDRTLLAVGPVAFPTLPPDAEDLPHIMDVETRAVDRSALARQVESRLRAEAAGAVDGGDEERMSHLLDVTYDIEAWAPVDVGGLRARIDSALDGDGDGDSGSNAGG